MVKVKVKRKEEQGDAGSLYTTVDGYDTDDVIHGVSLRPASKTVCLSPLVPEPTSKPVDQPCPKSFERCRIEQRNM